MRIILFTGLVLLLGLVEGKAFTVLGTDANGIAWRWDAAARAHPNNPSVERSLAGGLRYSVQGGSYAGYHGLFSFEDGTTAGEFENIVRTAFSTWEAPDTATGLTTDLEFVEDLTTTATTSNSSGAEIDLLGGNIGATTQGLANIERFEYSNDVVTLSSGVAGHGRAVITGARVTMNTNTLWTAASFRAVLTHEIGHTIGLGDVDYDGADKNFDGLVAGWYDDNYDSSTQGSQSATLTNSFAALIDVYDPEGSVGIGQYAIATGVFDAGAGLTPNILMEGGIDGLYALTNDDYAGRQFLIPSTNLIPEPSAGMLLGLGALVLGGWRRRVRRGCGVAGDRG